MEGAHLQCVKNHHVKFEYKGMNTDGVADYTNCEPPLAFWMKKCLSSTHLNNEKEIMKHAQNRRCTSSICEQSLGKVLMKRNKNFWSYRLHKLVNKLKSRGFLASSLSTYDFSTLYTTLPHNLIKEKLTELIEQTFNREGSLYLACNDKNAFFTSEQPKRHKLWSCQKMCDALHYLLDNIFIRFGSKLYRQIVGIPMGTNCAPLVADLFFVLL